LRVANHIKFTITFTLNFLDQSCYAPFAILRAQLLPVITHANSGDNLFDRAVGIVAHHQKASTSFLQRQLKIGYNRAADLIDRMEAEGIIGHANHVGKREVLVRQRDEEF